MSIISNLSSKLFTNFCIPLILKSVSNENVIDTLSPNLRKETQRNILRKIDMGLGAYFI